ncbi:hypothetical protein LTS18_001256, partial [Coniosporium uncinatum]
MEVAGLVIGAVGLAGLFTTCLECIEYVQSGRKLGKDYVLLETKLCNQKIRFMAWGKACGFGTSDGYDTRLDSSVRRSAIERTMACIMMLFVDAEKFSRTHALQQGGKHRLRTNALLLNSNGSLIPRDALRDFLGRIEQTQRQASFFTAARWAIGDRKKFAELIQHLKDFIDDLQNLTRDMETIELQRHFVELEIETIADEEILCNMIEAGQDDNDAVSDAASRRLESIRGSSIAPSTFNTSSVVETFRTAATSWSRRNDDADIEPVSKSSADIPEVPHNQR